MRGNDVKESVMAKLGENGEFLSQGGLYYDKMMREVTLKRLR